MNEFETLIRLLDERIKKHGSSALRPQELRDMLKKIMKQQERDEWESEMNGIASELD